MIAAPAEATASEPVLRRLEWFLYRYAAVIGALALMYLFSFLYFANEIDRLPRALQLLIGAPMIPAWVLQVCFGVPLLAVAQVLSACWFWRRRPLHAGSVIWRIALAVAVFAVWAATVNRFELP